METTTANELTAVAAADSELLAAALRYATLRGWHVLPCQHKGKAPLTPHGVHDASSDVETIGGWWSKWPAANVGLACGPSGLVVIDLDGQQGSDSWAALHAEHGFDDATVMAQTARGVHLYFRAPDGVEIGNDTGRKLGAGIDVKSAGGYVIAPPSIHPSGTVYTWDVGFHPDDMDPAPLPEPLVRLLTTPSPRATANTTGGNGGDGGGGRISQGQRNDTLYRDGCAMRRRGLSESAILAALSVTNRERCDPPIESEEVAGIAHSAAQHKPADSAPVRERPSEQIQEQAKTPEPERVRGADLLADLAQLPLTDSGNREAMGLLYDGRALYDHRRKRWLVWAGHRWKPDGDGAVQRMALEAIRERLRAAAELDDSDSRKKVAAWALSSESAYRLRSMVSLAQDHPPFARTGETFDAVNHLLGCENGVVDLRSGELRPGRPDDELTMTTGLVFDPMAEAPRWERFLVEVLPSEAIRAYVKRLAGYSVFGDPREQLVALCWGGGCNGKGRMLHAICHALGDYAANTPFSTFELTKAQATNDVAALWQKRLVTASETTEARRLNEARVKAVSGGDPITARFLFGEFFTFIPTFTVWLSMNHKPIITGTDEGIWRRIRLIPFTVSFLGREDKTIDAQLEPEAPGILRWIVDGCLEWQRDGLREPSEVLAATAQYRAESDVVGQFWEDCVIEIPGARTKASDLLQRYREWCEAEGERPLNRTVLGRRLADRGYQKQRLGTGVHYLGIGLLNEQ